MKIVPFTAILLPEEALPTTKKSLPLIMTPFFLFSFFLC